MCEYVGEVLPDEDEGGRPLGQMIPRAEPRLLARQRREQLCRAKLKCTLSYTSTSLTRRTTCALYAYVVGMMSEYKLKIHLIYQLNNNKNIRHVFFTLSNKSKGTATSNVILVNY